MDFRCYWVDYCIHSIDFTSFINKLFFKDDYVVKVFASGLALLIFKYECEYFDGCGFAPVVGIPLPLFSYGGSSFVNFIITFAILENLIAFRYIDLYR